MEVESFVIGLLVAAVLYFYSEVWKYKKHEEARKALP